MNIIDLFDQTISGPWKNAGEDVPYKISRLDGTVFIQFRETVNNYQWLSNFLFFPWPSQPYKNMAKIWWAHAGFVTTWQSVRDTIQKEVADIYQEGDYIVISGYSRGASLAVLAHEDFVFTFPERESKIFTYAFEPARVLWFPPKEIKSRWKNVTVYRNYGDPVPMIPFWIMGYRHAGTVKKIGNKWNFPWASHHMHDEVRSALQ